MNDEFAEKIVQLRTEGRSYEEIAEQLGLSEQLIIEWIKARQEIIKNKGCNC